MKPTLISLFAATIAISACGNSDVQPAAAENERSSDPTPPAETSAELTAQISFEHLPEPYKSADAERGRRVFNQCKSCHTLEQGGAVMLGPNLYGMFGSVVGSSDAFDFSDALREADFVWTPEQLDAWLADPRGFLPGNRMNFAGVRREPDRVALIAYVMAETGPAPTAP